MLPTRVPGGAKRIGQAVVCRTVATTALRPRSTFSHELDRWCRGRRWCVQVSASGSDPSSVRFQVVHTGTGLATWRHPVHVLYSYGHFVEAKRLALAQPHASHFGFLGRTYGGLPLLTVLDSSERCCQVRGRRHRKLTDWGRQLVLQARRWLPGRKLIVVAVIMRLQLDAAPYSPAPRRLPGSVRVRASTAGWLQAVRDWEAKLTPAMPEDLQRFRLGKIGRSWFVDETYLRVAVR